MINKSLASLKIPWIKAKITNYLTCLFLTFSTSVFGDLIGQRAKLVNKFVNDMHADPIVADCAAHGSFIASTSMKLVYVDFPPDSFKRGKFTITPWNDSFDQKKQRVKVDSIVTVNGLGITKNDNSQMILKFRCGYVGTQILAFNWNEPASLLKTDVRYIRHSLSYSKSFLFQKNYGKRKWKK
ncbi:MAG: hypothetical protein REV35_01610 [Burkholderia sp.]|nr:hypothetical protein [Burkholderia sp.]